MRDDGPRQGTHQHDTPDDRHRAGLPRKSSAPLVWSLLLLAALALLVVLWNFVAG